MLRILIAVVVFLCLSLGIFLLARRFRQVGQEILDTGLQPKHWFLNTPPEDTPTPAFMGHLLKISGLCGYILAVGILIPLLINLIQMLASTLNR